MLDNKRFQSNETQEIVTIVGDNGVFYNLSNGANIKKDIFFQKYKYGKMRKRYKKIEDVEIILEKYNDRFKKSADILERKIHRLLPLIIEKL